MRSAPSVTCPVGRCRFGSVVSLLAWLAGFAALLLWLAQGRAPGWGHGATALALAASGYCAWRAWRRAPCGSLAWDGTHWTWSEAARAQQVTLEVILDLQSMLLLRMVHADEQSAQVRWLWLAQDQDTLSWQALRRAVYFRAGQQAQPGAAPAQP